ncbi:YaiI/YqxD family protein [Legionella sp. CNM-4043-24]|uniref:YaiI/YqxD family protein n=1 Tax=Legionella sp. CNM-4043-24 TaxID=3421646 RepID=UPI00403AEF35
MRIWVDADACPAVVKDILYRAAKRTNTNLILVANAALNVPPSPLISTVRVGHGFDVADNYIVQHLDADDLVITADIPLAAEVIEKGALALNPRGELYTRDNIRQRLGMRDIMEQLRATGTQTGGPAAYGAKEKMAFANAVDRLLANRRKL